MRPCVQAACFVLDRERSRVAVEACRREMLDAAKTTDLESAQVAKELNEVYARLSIIGARKGVWIPTAADVANDPFDPAAQLAGAPATAGVGPPARRDRWLRRRHRRANRQNLVQFLVLALAVTTAILVALPTVFTDDTFGTWRDYLAALGLGGVAAAAAKGLWETAALHHRAFEAVCFARAHSIVAVTC